MNCDDLEELEIDDHFFVELAERWAQVISPSIGIKDARDLISQMSLVSYEQADELQNWYELEI